VTGSSSGSPTTGMSPMGAVDLGEGFRMVGLAREVAHWHGGGLGLGQDFMKSRIAATIFIGGKQPKT
jgi:hypothetical protein